MPPQPRLPLAVRQAVQNALTAAKADVAGADQDVVQAERQLARARARRAKLQTDIGRLEGMAVGVDEVNADPVVVESPPA